MNLYTNTHFGNAVQYGDLPTQIRIRELSDKVLTYCKQNGYVGVDIPVLDGTEKFVINDNFGATQNLYKCVAGDGQVLAMPDDTLHALINMLISDKKALGRFCTQANVFSFLCPTNPQNKNEICLAIVGNIANETDEELCSLAIDIAKMLSVDPVLLMGHTEITQGILDNFAQKNERKERVQKILNGIIESDVDFSCSQTYSVLKKSTYDDTRTTLKEISKKIDNQRSINGLLNAFEVVNLLEAEEKLSFVRFDPLYLGESPNDSGIVFRMGNGGDSPLLFGGRLACKNGNEMAYVSYLKINMTGVATRFNGSDMKSDSEKVTILLSDTVPAFIRAKKLSAEFRDNGLCVNMCYKCNEEKFQNYVSKSSPRDGLIVFVDGAGNIRHS